MTACSWRVALAALAAIWLAGCSDGPTRHRVHGTVTFQGKPVADGALFFEPTASVGEFAPTIFLRIHNSKYDTGKDGPVAGKHIVRVGGYDASKSRVDDDGISHTAQLFQDHTFEVTIPPPNNTLNIDVPASRAIRQP